ncbi:MAG: thiamine pyrophosphate-dependent enzyme, partial [Bacteroidales bacterium]|nr:thiamine pyrophosphate-dependent enzyme [Bacteroidales bacterium]
IGGNHFIHTVRRNVDINIVLMNNGIYGLTKGQYAPTSKRGFVSKSSPYGTVEDPFNAADLCFGAGGQFFARIMDVDLKNSQEVMKQAAQHQGCSVVEALVNCIIFNDGTHKDISAKDVRDDHTIFLRHGERMIFGKDRDKGLIVDGFKLKVVKLGENGISEKDILIHDAKCQDKTLHFKLGHMKGPEFPMALGIIRDAEAPVYDQDVYAQLNEVKPKHNYKSLNEFFMSLETWEIK